MSRGNSETPMRGSMKRLLTVSLLALAIFAVACGSDDDSESSSGSSSQATPQASGQAAATQSSTQSAQSASAPQEPANKSDLARLKGDIVIDGSSTVYPVTQ